MARPSLPGGEGGFVVSFPDVPEAITQGDNRDQARAAAEEALGLALSRARVAET